MFFHKALHISAIIFFVGVGYRLLSWFIKSVGMEDEKIPASKRFFLGIEGILLTLFTGKILVLIKVFVVDVLFQARILKDKEDPTAWIMHLLIFYGFMGLLLLHAFDIPGAVSSDNYPTTNPYMFLRNLFGLMVILGLVLAILRRTVWMKSRIRTSGKDIYAIAIMGVIVFSGFFLEGLKIGSFSDYERMVQEYGDVSDENERRALEAYWVKNFSVVSPNIQEPIPTALLVQGKNLHEMSCSSCHAHPRSAFGSYAVAVMIKPLALVLDRKGVHTGMYYIHILAILVGLAYFAFSKMFHIFSTPICVLVAELSKGKQDPAAVATRNMMERDGCDHGGICHTACPVRQKRQERIELTTPFEPVLDFVGDKDAKDLGCRYIDT
jgi:nitrate reductase gamma subunit